MCSFREIERRVKEKCCTVFCYFMLNSMYVQNGYLTDRAYTYSGEKKNAIVVWVSYSYFHHNIFLWNESKENLERSFTNFTSILIFLAPRSF